MRRRCATLAPWKPCEDTCCSRTAGCSTRWVDTMFPYLAGLFELKRELVTMRLDEQEELTRRTGSVPGAERPPGGPARRHRANLATGKLGVSGKGAFGDGVVTCSRGRPSAARAGAAGGPLSADQRRDLHGADHRPWRGRDRQGPARRLGRLAAVGRVPRPRGAAGRRGRDWLRCVGSAVLRTATGRAASVPRARRNPPPGSLHTG